MSHEVAVVGGDAVTLGFRLVGFRPHVVESAESAATLLADMAKGPQWGVILVQHDLMPEVTPAQPRRSAVRLPIVVPIPGPTRERREGEAEAYVAELLRQAVGYRVRLR